MNYSKKLYFYDYNYILINNETEVDFIDSVDLLNIFKKTNLIFTIIITIVGLIGHFLTILIFGQKRFRIYHLRFISTYIIISFNLQRLFYVCLPFETRFNYSLKY